MVHTAVYKIALIYCCGDSIDCGRFGERQGRSSMSMSYRTENLY